MSKILKTKKSVNSNQDQNLIDDTPKFFSDIYFYVLPNGMGKIRTELFRNAVLKHGGLIIDENMSIEYNSTKKYFVIFDENTFSTWQNLEISLSKKTFMQNKEISNSNLKFLASKWLSECLREKLLIDIMKFEMMPIKKQIEKRPSQIESYRDEKKIRVFEPVNNSNPKAPLNSDDSSEGSY